MARQSYGSPMECLGYRDPSTFSEGDWRHCYVGLEGPVVPSEVRYDWIPRDGGRVLCSKVRTYPSGRRVQHSCVVGFSGSPSVVWCARTLHGGYNDRLQPPSQKVSVNP